MCMSNNSSHFSTEQIEVLNQNTKLAFEGGLIQRYQATLSRYEHDDAARAELPLVFEVSDDDDKDVIVTIGKVDVKTGKVIRSSVLMIGNIVMGKQVVHKPFKSEDLNIALQRIETQAVVGVSGDFFDVNVS